MIEYNGQKVTIMATSKCNINCKHCYISFKGSFDPDNLKKIASRLSEKYFVSINGAELLTDPRYLDVLKELKQISFMSNGLVLCKDETIKKLKESNIECVAMSMHYGIQEDISVIPQKLVEDNVKILKENNIGSKIFVTITKKNYKLVPEICEYVASLGVHGVWFTNYIKQGQAINLEDNVLNEEEKKEFFKLLNEARSKYSKEELNIERCGSFGKDTYNNNNNNFRCTAIHDFVVLTPDYNVYPCFFLAKEGNEIGKYDNGKIMLYDEYKEEWDGCLTTRICNDEDYRIENHKLIRIKKQ